MIYLQGQLSEIVDQQCAPDAVILLIIVSPPMNSGGVALEVF